MDHSIETRYHLDRYAMKDDYKDHAHECQIECCIGVCDELVDGDRLRAELAALRRDAARWRKCEQLAELPHEGASDYGFGDRFWFFRIALRCQRNDTFAAAIDREIKKEQGE